MKKQGFIVFLLLINGLIHAQVSGCTDPFSKNYNPMATVNDGSCEYKQVSISPAASVNLPAEVEETSGLVLYNNELVTHNDNTDSTLYSMDSTTGTVLQVFSVTGSTNQDWEELAQDNDYFYIGDFGNNVSGNRTNLHILKVSKQSLIAGNPEVKKISFSYSDQTDFSSQNNNATDFDCEAMVVSQDSIYLFTKQWVSKKTSVYALPKNPGNHIAQFKAGYDVNGFITGATYLEDKKLLVLCGYSAMVSPFFYLLYDFEGHNFFSGNKRKVTMSGVSFHQAEGIATANGLDFFVTNEHLSQQPFVNVAQKLHRFDLSSFLENYLENLSLSTCQNEIRSLIRIYPNPARDILHIDADAALNGLRFTLYDTNGREAMNGMLNEGANRINVSRLSVGIYTVKLDKYLNYSYKLVKK